jgi:hypothetical protein
LSWLNGCCLRSKAPCTDVYDAFNGPSGRRFDGSYVAADHVHPNQRGHALIASMLAKFGCAPLSPVIAAHSTKSRLDKTNANWLQTRWRKPTLVRIQPLPFEGKARYWRAFLRLGRVDVQAHKTAWRRRRTHAEAAQKPRARDEPTAAQLAYLPDARLRIALGYRALAVGA